MAKQSKALNRECGICGADSPGKGRYSKDHWNVIHYYPGWAEKLKMGPARLIGKSGLRIYLCLTCSDTLAYGLTGPLNSSLPAGWINVADDRD